MKYNGINVSEQEIVAKVLEDQNAWRDFSINCTFSIEEIEKYKDNIIWDFYYRKINSTYYSQEEIEKILSIILDNDYLKDSKYILKAIFSEIPVSIEFIKKLVQRNDSFLLMTNSIKSPEVQIKRLNDAGFTISKDKILSPIIAINKYLKDKNIERVKVIGTEAEIIQVQAENAIEKYEYWLEA